MWKQHPGAQRPAVRLEEQLTWSWQMSAPDTWNVAEYTEHLQDIQENQMIVLNLDF